MIRLSRSAVFVLGTWLIIATTAPAPSRAQSAILPAASGGWTRADSVELYRGTDLYLLIDGGADLFLEYGFEQVLSSEYTHPPDLSATTELYEMKSSTSAYGLFTAFTAGTGTPATVGQEAVLGNGYCIFWKGIYVGMLTAATVDSSTGPMLLELAAGLEKEIRHSGTPPDLCTRLSEGGFESRDMVYVRGKLALRNHLPHSWATSLPPTDGVIGTSGSSRYLVLEYADSAVAAAALTSAAAQWEHLTLAAVADSSGRWSIGQSDGDVTVVEQHTRHILAVSGEKSESFAVVLSLRNILAEM